MPLPWPDRRVALRLLAGGAALALAACGRKGAPLPPYNVDPCYPRRYPLDQGAKDECAKKEEYAREHPQQPAPKKGEEEQRRPPAAQPPAAPSAPAPSSSQPPTPPDQPQ
jgi:predicted small lipoprotein YifL